LVAEQDELGEGPCVQAYRGWRRETASHPHQQSSSIWDQVDMRDSERGQPRHLDLPAGVELTLLARLVLDLWADS
jgi:hypothetical protein